eukprot:CAMPEP_0204270444 /NCGR_PEP_ID=MMETSP0468-20130131/18902_1 /ASSEMBLY_ACC=CAM_ASM_000383 /TAXON_ID=2969 /ORGANISM="Oxyrrhis marina" /LENGTH=270 /DNA_ID=CAMNT_0051245983 /DNA_START=65 /DNA_END=874 /DNA_ORIENTATION=-
MADFGGTLPEEAQPLNSDIHPAEMMKPGPNFHGASLVSKVPGLTWPLLYFSAAAVVLASGVIALFIMIINAFSVLESPFRFLNAIYLCAFGAFMIILDFPWVDKYPQVHAFRAHIYHFVLFLTRKVGRGIWYFFLGSLVFAALWDDSTQPFLAVVLGAYVGFVGLVALWVGYCLSKKLALAKSELLRAAGAGEPRAFVKQRCPPTGLNCSQFQSLLNELVQSGEKPIFTENDMQFVSVGLCNNPQSKRDVNSIAKEDFDRWIDSPENNEW